MPHVVVEGPDGAGKTTLARAVARLGWAYSHEGPPPSRRKFSGWRRDRVSPNLMPGAPFRRYVERLLDPTPHVYDRLHLGEAVYPLVLRGQPGLSPYHLKLLRRVVRGVGAQVVLLLPSLKVCMARWQFRNEAGGELVKERLAFEDTYRLFQNLEAQADAVLRDDYLDVFAWAQELVGAGEVARRESRFVCPRPAIGSPEATVLVVGERVNGGPDAPFLGDANSSRFLNDALAVAGVAEVRLALVNAFTKRGAPVDLTSVVTGLRRLKTVVLLGALARKAWRDQRGLVWLGQTIELNHPAHAKRFGNKFDDYVKRLEGL